VASSTRFEPTPGVVGLGSMLSGAASLSCAVNLQDIIPGPYQRKRASQTVVMCHSHAMGDRR